MISGGPPIASCWRRKCRPAFCQLGGRGAGAPRASAAANLPDSPERARQELTLQLTLGPPLIATKGWPGPEVEGSARAHELCQQVGETAQLFSALWGLWYSELDKRNRAWRSNSLPWLSERRTRGFCWKLVTRRGLVICGEANGPLPWPTWNRASVYDPQKHRSYASLYAGHDPGVCCLCHAAWCLWMLGYPDRAWKKSSEALVLARQLSDPTGLARADFLSGQFHQFRQDGAETLQHAEEVERLAAEQGLAFYSGGSIDPAGLGAGQTGASRGRSGSDARGTGGLVHGAQTALIQFLTMLAEVCGQGGKVEEGLAVLAETLQRKGQGSLLL